jgi:hypothetical protein
MSFFFGTMVHKGKKTVQGGSKRFGLLAHVSSPDCGVEISAVTEKGQEEFILHATSGQTQRTASLYLGRVKLDKNGTPQFIPPELN